MLHKKGDQLIPENFRAIVLTNTLKKVYEGLIANRLTTHKTAYISTNSDSCQHGTQQKPYTSLQKPYICNITGIEKPHLQLDRFQDCTSCTLGTVP
jgi:hypothetical protein